MKNIMIIPSNRSFIEELFERESFLGIKELEDDSKLGLGFKINPVDIPSYYYLTLLRNNQRIDYNKISEEEKEAYRIYNKISSISDFESTIK